MLVGNAIKNESYNVRGFNLEQDYDMLYKWWRLHNSFPPKRDQLSDCGLIVERENNPICAGFLYSTDSSICVFEFVVCDPTIDKEIRDKALTKLIEEAQKWAAESLYSLIYTSVRGLKYINRLKNAGFIEVDKEMTHMFYEVKEIKGVINE